MISKIFLSRNFSIIPAYLWIYLQEKGRNLPVNCRERIPWASSKPIFLQPAAQGVSGYVQFSGNFFLGATL